MATQEIGVNPTPQSTRIIMTASRARRRSAHDGLVRDLALIAKFLKRPEGLARREATPT
jgi:hypothetical protein